MAALIQVSSAGAATVLHRSDADLIREAHRIVRGQVVDVRTETDASGGIFTLATIAVAEDFSGRSERYVQVRELGGFSGESFVRVDGAARYELGSDVLVILERSRSGSLRSAAMGMAKFDVVPSPDGDPLLLRNLGGIDVLGAAPVARTLRLSALRALARQVRGPEAVRRLQAVAPLNGVGSFTLLRFGNGLGVRWTEADSGIPIRWYVDTSAPAPLTDGSDGSREIQTALSAWTAPADASIDLSYRGPTDQTPHGPWPSLGGSGAGVIFYEDPNDEIASNVLAIGGGGGTANDGGTVNGVQFNRFTYGFVIVQNAAALPANFRQSRDFARVIQHEIGHAIGLGHTPSDGSVAEAESNIMFPSCCGSATPVAPALGSDDRAGLRYIYPPAAACTYAVTPSSAFLPADGGNLAIDVATGASCQWTVADVPAWLALSGSTSRVGPGAVLLTVATNASRQSRAAVLAIAGQGVSITQQAPPDAPPLQAAHAGPGPVDLWWHHQGDGSLAAWFMDGLRLTEGVVFSRVSDTNWQVAGSGDLDGDGQTDLVWQNVADGQLSVWFMNGLSRRSGTLLSVPSVADVDWRIRSVGDLDGDGKADLFWQHRDGRVSVWLMDGVTVRSGLLLNPPQVSDTAWRLAGTGDFTGDGHRDLLWQHALDGRIAVWRMQGVNQIDGALTTPGQVADLAWTIRGVTDIDDDGNADLIWQHTGDGRLAAWLMRGLTMIHGLALTPASVADQQWKIAGPR